MNSVNVKGGYRDSKYQTKFEFVNSKRLLPNEQRLEPEVNESWFLHGTQPQFVLPIL